MQDEGSGELAALREQSAEGTERTERTERTDGADGTERTEGAAGPADGASEGAEGASNEGTEGETALETKRRKTREAQMRYYDKHKRKKDPSNPCPSYCPERIQAVKREYYTQHRDEIIARSKRRYQEQKAQKAQKAALERATGAPPEAQRTGQNAASVVF